MSPTEIAQAFVALIKARNPDVPRDLRSEDHVFIDAVNNRMSGRDPTWAACNKYFSTVPDHWIKDEVVVRGDSLLALFGTAGNFGYAPS